MARQAEYDDSPNRIDELVDADEIRRLLSGDVRALGKSDSKLRHLLSRMGNTIETYRRQILLLHRDVQQAVLSKSQVGTPSTLSPIDHVRFLSPEQFAAVADQMVARQIDIAKRQADEAAAEKTEARRMINEMRLVVASLLDDPSLPAVVHARLTSLLERFDGVAATPPPASGAGLGDLFN